jgi:hypothetical protein
MVTDQAWPTETGLFGCDAVSREPVSAPNSLLTGKLTGNFRVRSTRGFNSLQPNSLRNGTGNFQKRIRENFSRNREISNLRTMERI